MARKNELLSVNGDVFVLDVPKGLEVESVVVNNDVEGGDFVYIGVREKPKPPPVTVSSVVVRD